MALRSLKSQFQIHHTIKVFSYIRFSNERKALAVSLDFEFTSGSVAGRDHRKGVPRNCQDALSIRTTVNGTVVVVADGCGSSRYSEIGARIGVHLMTTHLQRQLARGYGPDASLLHRARQSVLSQLHVLAQDMGESLSDVVNKFLLFTLLGAVITSETALFFALGDGVIVVNGEVIVLDSGPQDMPIYLGYAMTGSSLTDGNPSLLDFSIVRRMPSSDLQHFLIGTDGVQAAMSCETRRMPGLKEVFGPLSQFWEKDNYFVPSTVAVTRRLNLLARDWPRQIAGKSVLEGGQLSDDTTLIAGRRREREE